MGKKIKVYLQYPWKFPDSPYYKYLIDLPPEGVEYLNAEKQEGVITSRRFFWFSNFLKRNIRRGLNILNLSIPNAHLSPPGEYDLIHCAHSLSKNNTPWVADLEGAWSMWLSGERKGLKKMRKILLDPNCKKLLPWCEATKEDLLELFPEVKDKVEVVYPAVPSKVKTKNISRNKIRIIFIARYFDIKGGLIALEVLERLRKRYGIEGIVVSTVPKELKNKYQLLKIYDLMPQKKLLELMKKSDLFLYPSMVDTFGFSLLEAMSLGIPSVTVNTPQTKSRREIVEDGKTGLIFDVNEKIDYNHIGETEEKIIQRLFNNCSQLIEDREKLKEMSRNCIREINKGKFSLRRRNIKLRRIYEEAIDKKR